MEPLTSRQGNDGFRAIPIRNCALAELEELEPLGSNWVVIVSSFAGLPDLSVVIDEMAKALPRCLKALPIAFLSGRHLVEVFHTHLICRFGPQVWGEVVIASYSAAWRRKQSANGYTQ